MAEQHSPPRLERNMGGKYRQFPFLKKEDAPMTESELLQYEENLRIIHGQEVADTFHRLAKTGDMPTWYWRGFLDGVVAGKRAVYERSLNKQQAEVNRLLSMLEETGQKVNDACKDAESCNVQALAESRLLADTVQSACERLETLVASLSLPKPEHSFTNVTEETDAKLRAVNIINEAQLNPGLIIVLTRFITRGSFPLNILKSLPTQKAGPDLDQAIMLMIEYLTSKGLVTLERLKFAASQFKCVQENPEAAGPHC